MDTETSVCRMEQCMRTEDRARSMENVRENTMKHDACRIQHTSEVWDTELGELETGCMMEGI